MSGKNKLYLLLGWVAGLLCAAVTTVALGFIVRFIPYGLVVFVYSVAVPVAILSAAFFPSRYFFLRVYQLPEAKKHSIRVVLVVILSYILLGLWGVLQLLNMQSEYPAAYAPTDLVDVTNI